jgi:hypothetical protein
LFGKKANDEQQPNTHAHRHMHARTHMPTRARAQTGRKSKAEEPPNKWRQMCCPKIKFKKYARIYSLLLVVVLPLCKLTLSF